MKTYKFSELSDKAKVLAVVGYRQGLLDNRHWKDDIDDLPTIEECFDLCQDIENDVVYDAWGNCVGDAEETEE